MHDFDIIQRKLEAFIQKYYLNALLKGIILFFTIGVLYFLLTLFVEYLLWLDPMARTILFWIFILVEGVLFIRFIISPLTKLFKIKKGISPTEASKIIGKHFETVDDKLLNLIQLNESKSNSELLLASIAQKSKALSPIPFKLAIDLNKNLKYLKYAALPLAIILLSWATGSFNWFTDSYQRVVHYKTVYEPPAPFQFFVRNGHLNALENTPFKLEVKINGALLPEQVQIRYDNETYFMKKTGLDHFYFEFSKPTKDLDFQLLANEVVSQPYHLNVIKVPALASFEMQLDYPAYTQKRDMILRSTGNATVPEGTKVTWKLRTQATDQVHLFSQDTLLFETSEKNQFITSKRVFNKLEYAISTSNKRLKNYENLNFKIAVVKDQKPTLAVAVKVDTLDQETLYFSGHATDDYGLRKLQLVYYPIEAPSQAKLETIAIPKASQAQFVTSFPNNLEIDAGVSYEMYFQIFDNDVFNKKKSTKSRIFSYRKRTESEAINNDLEQQNNMLKNLNQSLNTYTKQTIDLEKIKNNQKEKSILNFNDKKALKNFLKRQQQQDQMMRNFSKKLKQNLENFQKKKLENDPFKKALLKRLKANEKQLEKDEKTLKELKALTEKIKKEKLTDKLEKLSKNTKQKKRSLQQLLELTKRFYIKKKIEQLKDDLKKTEAAQRKLSKSPNNENTKEKQEALNKKFDDFQKAMEALEKENQELQKPIALPRNKFDEEDVKTAQKEALENLQKPANNSTSETTEKNKKEARKKQKEAADKMTQILKEMTSKMAANEQAEMKENKKTLRQILDNLLLFSFEEEAIMDTFKQIEKEHHQYAHYLRKQHNLREHFQHVDDSLFALSLRDPDISERINEQITEVYFNVDKALENLAENKIYQGVSNQQFAVTATNELTSFLSDVLDNMNTPSQSQSDKPGTKDGEQLPDIIMSQKQLSEKMKLGLKKQGEKPGDNENGEKDPQNSGKTGESDQNKGKKPSNQESLDGKIFEIYKAQQQLREALEKQLAKDGNGSQGKKLLKDMEAVETMLLEKGFTQATLQRMMRLEHELLKLKNATFQQGQDHKRQSKTNQKKYVNTIKPSIEKAKSYFNIKDILNRESLPLQYIYKKRVQVYFNKKE